MTETEPERSFPDPFPRALLDTGKLFELILVRHGQQRERLIDDSPLSELGHRQAGAVATFLRDENIAAIYSSHLSRAHDTGLAIAGQHDLECTVDERLREIELGRDVPEGKRMSDFIDEDVLRANAESFVDERRWDNWAMSETGSELRDRIGRALDDIRATHAETTGKVVIACHGGVINAIVASELGVAMDYFFKAAHASVHRLRVGHDRLIIESLNDTRHLPGELLTY